MSEPTMNRDPLHEDLCAMLLGEADGPTRARVEAALAADPALVAERDRLAGVLGLVQDTLGADERLSDSAVASLMEAASDPERSEKAQERVESGVHEGPRLVTGHSDPGPRRAGLAPFARAAAAVLLVIGGVWAALTHPGAESYDQKVAHGDLVVGGSATLAEAHLMREASTVRRRILARLEGQASGSMEDESYGRHLEYTEAIDTTVLDDRALDDRALDDGALDYGATPAPPMRMSKRELTAERQAFFDEVDSGVPSTQDLSLSEAATESLDRSGNRWHAGAGEARRELRKGVDTRTSTLERSVAPPGTDTAPIAGLSDPSRVNPGNGPDITGAGLEVPQVQPRPALKLATPEPRVDPSAGFGLESGVSAPESFYLGLENQPDAPEPITELREQLADQRQLLSEQREVPTVIAIPGGVEDGEFDPQSPLSRADSKAAERSSEGLYFTYDGLQGGGEDEVRRPAGRRPALELDHLVNQHWLAIRQDCARLPHERPRDMFFRWWGDNPFEVTQTDRLSTFAADVDTASYVLARRYLREGTLPTRAQIRTEEFVNYFDPDLVAPTNGDTFALSTELAPSLFGGSERRWQLRVGVRGKEVQREERAPLRLTFVIDTSGSMEENRRLELVKHALRLLVSQLDGRDMISIVAFSKEARLVLPMTSAASRGLIESAVHPLTADGGTNAEAGLMMGYEAALADLDAQAHNRVVLLSDGVANLGQTDQDRINESVARHRDAGIYLNTIGVGMNNHDDAFLEQLANKGDGVCDYVDDAASTERAIVERFTGAMVPIASDVKIQVEFDPSQVLRYRLLGYENRVIVDADFRDDAVDAGEVGAGHQVTAIYEIERAGGPVQTGAPLAKVNLRWKEPKAPGQDPREVQVTEVAHEVHAATALGSWDTASVGFRRASLVAQFAEVLRASTHAQGDSLEALQFELRRLADLPELAQDADTAELPGLVQRAIDLGLAGRLARTELGKTVDEYRRHRFLCEQLDELEARSGSGGRDHEDLIRLRRVNDELEQRIERLIREQLSQR